MASEPSILVLGAGELGSAMLRSLAAAPNADQAIHVLLRPTNASSKRQQQLALLHSLGISVVNGDLVSSSVADLASIFARYHTVIGCTGFVAGAHTQRKLAEAVLQAAVPRYIPWQFGVDYDRIGRGSSQDLFDEQLDVRDMLRAQQSTAWTIISTGMFTSFLFEPSFGVVNLSQPAVHALGAWENAVTVTTPADIGLLTAAILRAEPPLLNQVVFTAGETITYAQLASTTERVLARPVERILWDTAMLKQQLKNQPEDALRKYRVLFAEGIGVSWPVEGTFNAQQHIDLTSVETWLRSHLETSFPRR